MASLQVEGLRLEVPHYVQEQPASSSWGATLLRATLARPRREFTTLLDDVSFSVKDGDRVALLGRNGAGKTSLLRVLTGAFKPTKGIVRVSGTRQALLNLSLGFNQEATLVENIYLRATAMDIPAAMVKGLVDSILDFSELRDRADRRLMTLSSGQRMRLGFAISTSIQHDIMLLDEWFGAGDIQFVKKARARMMSRVQGSRIVILASHNTGMLEKMCNRAILMEGGRLIRDGDVPSVMAEYKKLSPPKMSRKQRLKYKKKKELKKKLAAERAEGTIGLAARQIGRE